MEQVSTKQRDDIDGARDSGTKRPAKASGVPIIDQQHRRDQEKAARRTSKQEVNK